MTVKMHSTPWLIDPADLYEQQPEEHWRVVEVGSRELYERGHISTARFLPWQALMHASPPSPGLLPDSAQVENIFNYLQHNDGCHYWVYDNEGGGWAGRFVWLLHVLGHPHKTYIDGGKLAWQAEGLPLQSGSPQPAEKQTMAPTLQINASELVSAEDLIQSFATADPPTIWDARSAGEHFGQTRTARRNGHMPGAIHCEWTELMDPTAGYRIRRDAVDHLATKGLTRDKRIVTHCQSHHRSGFTYLVGKALEMNIRAYAGAWAEWGNRPDTPIICNRE